jgi:hypothetical protein
VPRYWRARRLEKVYEVYERVTFDQTFFSLSKASSKSLSRTLLPLERITIFILTHSSWIKFNTMANSVACSDTNSQLSVSPSDSGFASNHSGTPPSSLCSFDDEDEHFEQLHRQTRGRRYSLLLFPTSQRLTFIALQSCTVCSRTKDKVRSSSKPGK